MKKVIIFTEIVTKTSKNHKNPQSNNTEYVLFFFLFVRTQTSVIVAHMVTITDTVTTALPSKLHVQRKHGIFVSFIWLDDWNRFNTGSVFHDKKPCPLPVSVNAALLAGEFRTRHFVFPNQHWLLTNTIINIGHSY